MRWLVSAALYCCMQLLVSAEDYCFSDEQNPYNFLATKTAYEVVRDHNLKIGSVPDCTPVMIWGLFRHGTRYPHSDEIKKQMGLLTFRDTILRNEPQDMELCEEDQTLLKDWTYNVNMSQADLLTQSGMTELELLAKRMRNNFADVLNAHYSEDRFKIRFTNKERTKQSAKAFTTELFGSPIDLQDTFVDENLLEPNDNCSTWKMSTHGKGAERETENFRKSDLMKSLIWSVSRRLGFRHNLTYDIMSQMYDMCRFDKAWDFKNISPWCAVFQKQHLKVMEYDEDLEYYYRSGYGNPFTLKLGCPLVKDLIESLNNRTLVNTTEESGEPSAVLYFTHSLTLRSTLVRLGMAKDKTPITADSFTTMDKRQWRTSFITPFAGNLVAVLYKCVDQQYKVMFYLNEHYVEYDGCKVGLCDWSYIYSRFKSVIDSSQCNKDFCNMSGTSIVVPSMVLITIGILFVFNRFD